MLKRILTGIVAFCFILVPVVFFAHTIVLPIAISVFALIASYEILHCVGLHKNIWISVPLYLMSGALPFALWYFEARCVNLLSLLLCIPMLWMLAVAIFSHGKADIRDVSTAFMLWIYSIMGFLGLIYIHDLVVGGKYFYLLIFVGAWMTDIFAYFVGVLFGKHKLIPDVSPKKTIEGAVGGTVFCILGFVGFGLLYNHFWIAEGSTALPIWFMMLMGLFVSLVSQIGDLALSLLKRKYGIKDFGKILPGHGGVLDRCDSVLAVSIILCIFFSAFSLVRF